MNKDQFFEAFGQIDPAYVFAVDEILTGSRAKSAAFSRRKLIRAALIAAAIAGLLTVTAYAAGLFGLQERLIRDSGKGSVVLGITLEDLEDIMDIRLRCEGLAAFYAAKNRTEADAKRLRQLSELQDFYFEKGDYDHLREIDDEFHESIYEISGRTVLMDTLRPLHRKTQRYRRNSYSIPARRQKSINEHKAICDAICDGNAELAEQLVSQHIENAKITMIERFSQNG